MELRAAAVLLLFLCAIIFITTEGRLACCLDTTDKINQKILKRAQKYDIQSDAGPCERKALVLHVGMKKYCLDPKTEKKVKHVLRKMHSQKQQKQ